MRGRRATSDTRPPAGSVPSPRRLRGPGDLLAPPRVKARSHLRRIPRPTRRLVAVSCLVLAALATTHLAADGARSRRAWGETRRVVVIARPVAAGTPLVAGDLVEREVPAGLVPVEAVAAGGHGDRSGQAEPSGPGRTAPGAGQSGADALVGRVTATDLVAGELLVSARLAPAGFAEGSGAGPDGRVVAVPLDRAAPPLAPGDHVDLLAAGAAGSTASTVARRGEVVAVDEVALAVLVDGPEVGAVVAALLHGTVVPVLRPD